MCNTGSPQGCALSPTLFTLYSNDFKCTDTSCFTVKYADDTCLVGLICNDDVSGYRDNVDLFVSWCNANHLTLNVTKCKKIIFDLRHRRHDYEPLKIMDANVDVVSEHKYLGVYIDDKLNWKSNTGKISVFS